MSLASSQLSFLSTVLSFSSSSSPRSRRRHCRRSNNPVIASKLADHHPNGDENENGLAKLAIVTLAAGVLTLGSVHDDAFAAKTGGRVGGQAFRSAPPRPSSPRINNNNSRTNIYINPRVAPPLVGGYGYGYGVPYYGGWGWSPVPSFAVGIGGGFDTLLLFIFLGTVAAFARRLFGTRQDDNDEDDY